jgi:hypothetical protein
MTSSPATKKTRTQAPLYAIMSWNKIESLLVAHHQLTNNTCERANPAWNATVGPRPSFYVVLEHFITKDSYKATEHPE